MPERFFHHRTATEQPDFKEPDTEELVIGAADKAIEKAVFIKPNTEYKRLNEVEEWNGDSTTAQILSAEYEILVGSPLEKSKLCPKDTVFMMKNIFHILDDSRDLEDAPDRRNCDLDGD